MTVPGADRRAWCVVRLTPSVSRCTTGAEHGPISDQQHLPFVEVLVIITTGGHVNIYGAILQIMVIVIPDPGLNDKQFSFIYRCPGIPRLLFSLGKRISITYNKLVNFFLFIFKLFEVNISLN